MLDRESASKYINDLLELMVNNRGSDLFITSEFPPAIKVDGKITPVSQQPLNPAQALGLVRSIMNERQVKEFDDSRECNFAITAPNAGRFRVSAFIQQGKAGMVVRTINTRIPSVEDLDLPTSLHEIVMAKRGLVIVTGATGSGKSTSLAAMLDHRNAHSYGHIITIEDPIEYVHAHQNCIVTQREVGIDTESVARGAEEHAAPGAGRDPDRRNPRPRRPWNTRCRYAETAGHLCLATLHANNANQAHRPDHQLLPRGEAPAVADRPVAEPARR